jgi:hypothetical protein
VESAESAKNASPWHEDSRLFPGIEKIDAENSKVLHVPRHKGKAVFKGRGGDDGVHHVHRDALLFNASQVDIPAGIPVALKIRIKAAPRSEEFNHLLGGRRRRRGGGMDRRFEQTGGIGLDITAPGGSLTRQRRRF